MLNRFWIPTLAATALLLSACGDSDVPTETPADEAPAEQSSQPAEPDPQAEGNADAPVQYDAPASDDLNDAQQNAPAGNDEAGSTTTANVEADNETLSVDPQDVLNNEDAAMPGEVTTSDVDKVISDIDKRFEQAEQELKAQFEEAEKEAPAVESLPGENDVSARGDVALPEDARSMDEPSVDELSDSSVSNTPALDGELGKTEVDELIEDAERRFEETQKRMQKQFEELEQEDVEPSSDALQPMSESDAVPQGSMDADAESQTP
jgi:polyhydroxyalkanoate synthesis regulator phasin